MEWYDKYLQVYERNFDAVAYATIISEVRTKLKKIQSDTPLVTVSVIAYNEEKHLLASLWALSDLVTKYPIEIIGVDNDSIDKTAEIFRAVGVKFYTEYQHSCGYARLCGLVHARGKYHVNVDADTLYPPLYVDSVINILETSEHVMGVCATWGYIPDEKHSKLGLMFYEFFRDIYLNVQSWKRPELSVRGLVFTYRTEEANRIGINVNIIRGEDGALAFGLKRYGRIVFLRNRKVRAVTGYGTMGESLTKRFIVRTSQIIHNIVCLFTSAKEYKDQDYNKVKRI